MSGRKRGNRDSRRGNFTSKTSNQEKGWDFDTDVNKGQTSEPIEPSQSKDERLEQSTLDYFDEVSKKLEENDFEDEEDKELFVTNVLKSVNEEATKLAFNKRASKILESFFCVCSEREVLNYAETIEDSIWDFFTHHCASHVLQTLLETSIRLIRNRGGDQVKDETEKFPSIEKFVEMIVDQICSNLNDLIVNEHASHVICSVVEVLSGHKFDSIVSQSKASHRNVSKVVTNEESVTVPNEFGIMLETLVDSIVQLDFEPLSKIPCSSVVLQFVLLALNEVNEKRCEKVVRTISALIFSKKDTNGAILEQLKDQTTAHLVEVIIKVSTPKSYRILFNEYFKGNLNTLAVNRTANFVVQRLISKCSDKQLFDEIYNELENDWFGIATAGHLGVLTSLSESCVRFISCQVKFVKNLSGMLNCEEFSEAKFLLVPLVASLSSYDEWKEMGGFGSNWEVNYHGSILIQNMLHFHKPFRVVESLLKMPSKDLLKLLCNSFGSHIMDSFVKSKTIAGIYKMNMINQMEVCLVELACDRHGSRCLEALFKGIDIKGKFLIAEKLVEDINKLRSDPIGTFVVKKFYLDGFKRNWETWQVHQTMMVKKRDLFEDVLSQAKKKMKK